MNKHKILIVEDDEATLRMLEKGFRLAGFTVSSAEGCDEAFKLLNKNNFDCLLTDYCLKDGTAFNICKSVRADEKIKKMPIVILSGHSEKSLSSYTVCQADFFVEKDKTCKEVVEIVKSLFRRLEWERGIVKNSDITLEPESSSVFINKKRIIKLPSEQFLFFSIIFKKSPDFVDEEEIVKNIFDLDSSHDKSEAIRSLVCRLRQKLGKQLGRRIKNNRRHGWGYLSPQYSKDK
jgi:DNA-binding response OmpR family regulator